MDEINYREMVRTLIAQKGEDATEQIVAVIHQHQMALNLMHDSYQKALANAFKAVDLALEANTQLAKTLGYDKI